jgi:hypothetical protein
MSVKIFLSEEELKQAVRDYIGKRMPDDLGRRYFPEIESIKVKRRTSSEEATGIIIEKWMLQGELHTGPMLIQHQIVNMVINPEAASLKILCHDCGTVLKEMKLEWNPIIGR